MTTAAGDFVIDFKVLPDADPYVNASLTFLIDTPQLYSGLVNSKWTIDSKIIFYDNSHTYSVAKSSLIEKNSPSSGGGESGPGLYDSSGNGYELKLVYEECRIFVVSGGGLTRSALGFQVNLTYAAGSVFKLSIDASGNLSAEANGVDIGFGPINDTTYAPSTLKAGGYSDRNSSGGGYQSGIFSFAALGAVTSTTYVSNSSGNANNPTTWTPNGIPSTSDTVTIGAHAITVPAGFSWTVGAITMTGTSSSTRSEIIVSATGELKQYGDITLNTWNRLTFIGASTWDVNGHNVKFDTQAGTGVHNFIQHTSASASAMLTIKNSGSLATIGKADGTTVYGRLDMHYAKISGVNWRFGGGYYAGHHCRLDHVIFHDYGYFKNEEWSHPDDDWYLRNVDFRTCLNAQTVSGDLTIAEICSKAVTADPATGVKAFNRVTFSSRNLSDPTLSVRTYDFTNVLPDHVYFDRMKIINTGTPTALWNRVFSYNTGVFGSNGGVTFNNTFVAVDSDAPKPFWNCEGILNSWVIEAKTPTTATAQGEHFTAVNSRYLETNNLVLIDTCGSSVLSAVSSARTGTYIFNHMTAVYDIQFPDAGLIRNTSSGSFSSSSNVTLDSSIEYVRSNPSGNSAIRVFNLATAADDQIEFFDYNSYYGVSSTSAIVYTGVTSATKTIGQAGYGQNDWINTQNPSFLDPTRSMQAWGATVSVSGYDNTITYLMNTINGYNPATKLQDVSLVSGYTVVDLLSYVRGGFAPTNAAYLNSGTGGVTRGAIEVVAAIINSVTNPTLANSTGNAITTTGLGTLTTLTIGGKSATSISAPSGDGTYSFPDLVPTQTFPAYGTQTVIAGDGTNTATSSTVLSPKTGKTFVTLTSVGSGVLYVGDYVSVNVGDQITYSTAAALGVTVNSISVAGGIQSDYVGSQEILVRNVSTGIITQHFIITGVADTTPDPFSFTNQTDVPISNLRTSNTITITGLGSAAPISTGGQPYKIGNGSYVTADGTINNNETLTLQRTSSASYSTPLSTTVNIGGVTSVWTVTTIAALSLISPSTVTEASNFTITFNKTGTTKHLYLETTDGVKVLEQIVDTWNPTSATGSYVQGNWLQVLTNALPSGTTDGVPFSSGTQSIRLRLTIDSETSTRLQTYNPPTGYTMLEYNSTTSNTSASSVWFSISGLANSDQILVSNTQVATDTTPLNIVWNADGTPTPSSNLAFNYVEVYFKNSTGKLTRVNRSYAPSVTGITSVNGGTPLHAGNLFTVTTSGITTSNIHFVQLQIGSKIWVLAKNATVSNSVINAYAPSDLPVSNAITVSIKEWKTSTTSGGGPSAPEITWVEIPKTSNFPADIGTGYLVDTSIAPVTMTLPLVPTVGKKVVYLDLAGTFNTNSFTIDPNGKKIYGLTSAYVTNSINEAATLIYTGETYGWKFLNVAPSI